MADTKIGIVYSDTTANLYFSKTAYSQLFMAAQNQALMAGVPFDILTETDLKDLNKLAQYDALVFPAFSAVKQADAAAIQQTLTTLVQNNEVSLIAAGDFMTTNQTGGALTGDRYASMKALFDLTPQSNGYGNAVIKAADISHAVMTGYTANEVIKNYTAGVDWAAYRDATTGTTPLTVLATQTVGSTTTNAMVANTLNGDTNVHIGSTSLLGDTNLLSQAITWAVNGAGPSVGLQLSRQSAILATRNDMDQSMYRWAVDPDNNANTADGIYDKMLPILEQWKAAYNFVGSYYVNIGNAPGNDETTVWSQSGAYYKRMMAMGNEIGSHTYTHPADTNLLTAAQIQFEFGQSRTVIQQQLGITITGAAVPGNPEQLPASLLEIQYYDYLSGGYSGVGSGYPNAFGYLSPTVQDRIYLAPNITFDFTQVEWLKKTPAQAEAAWAAEIADLSKHAEIPVLVWPIHDYAITQWEGAPYTLAMFSNLIAAANARGTEFVTLDDLARRMESQEKAVLDFSVSGSTVNASVISNDAGKFALDLDGIGAQVIKSVAGWYAYDNDSVFTDRDGGAYTITLGASQDDVTRIIKLPARGELVSLSGDGTNLNFTIAGEGQVVIDLANIGQPPQVTGATILSQVGDILTLRLGTNLISNGSFEAPVLSGDNFVGAVTGWTNTGGATLDVWKNLSGALASNGANFIELDNATALDTLRQTVTTAANTAYELSVDLRQRPGATAATNTVQVVFNNVVVATVEPNAAWTTHTFTVYGVAGSSTLEFREVSADNNSQGGLIDNVRLFQITPQTHNVSLTLAPVVNTPPTITSNGGGDTAALALLEGTTAVTTVLASDAQPGVVTYSISGADAAKFNINARTGALAFIAAPAFAAPTDDGANNVYDVVVRAEDAGGLADTQALAVSVTKIPNTAPTITTNGGGDSAALVIGENTTAVTTVLATDNQAGALAYSISGGVDAGKFQINGATGALSFTSAPVFANPTDAGANNVYDVIVRAQDVEGLFDTQTIAVTITGNSPPTITSNGGGPNAALSIAENTTAVTTVVATDVQTGALSYFITDGADAAKFQINTTTGVLSFVTGPVFANPTDSGANNVYDVVVRAQDSGGLVDIQAIAVTVTQIPNTAPTITSNGGGTSAALSVTENTTAVTTVIATDQQPGALTYSISGADAAKFQINAATGVLSFIAGPVFANPTDSGANNVYDVVVRAQDVGGLADTQAIAVTVTSTANTAPTITSNGGGTNAAVTIQENTSTVTSVIATDAQLGALVYSISGGADAAKFQINASTGALAFITPPDFEAATDAGANNVYDVIVRATDAGGLFDTQNLAVTISNVQGANTTGNNSANTMNGTNENDTLRGQGGADTISGLAGNDTLDGGAGNDTIHGGDGADTITGAAGNDTLNGNAGADRITGGDGLDRMDGGADADVFIYTATAQSNRNEDGVDIISNFQPGLDRIDVSAIDANTNSSGNQTFAFVGQITDVQSGVGRLAIGQIGYHYETRADGVHTIIDANVNTNRSADFQIDLIGQHVLTAADFLL